MKQQIKKEIISKSGELKSNAQRLTSVSGVSLLEAAVVVVVCARRLGRGIGGGGGGQRVSCRCVGGEGKGGGGGAGGGGGKLMWRGG